MMFLDTLESLYKKVGNTPFASPPLHFWDFVEPESIWFQGPVKKGDHIRVNRGLYYHHGVYFSPDEVIHFTGAENDNILDWSENQVITSDLLRFLQGGTLEIRGYTQEEERDLYHPDQIHQYAKSCLGDKGYNLLWNNCEHFSNTCTLGRHRSEQIERLTTGRFSVEGIGDDMGLFTGTKSFFKGLFGGGSSGGSRSTSSTVYEPDKVKIAEIQQQTQLLMADRELERIQYMNNAQLELLEFQTNSRIAVEQAKVQGMQVMVHMISEFQERMNQVAQQRLEFIEHGSLHLVKEMEDFYQSLGDKIKEDNDKYNCEKLPQLLALLAQYEEGTPQHTLYMKRIEQDMASQMAHHMSQLEQVGERQKAVQASFLEHKNNISSQTTEITKNILENLMAQSTHLSQQLLGLPFPNTENPTLQEKTWALESGTEEI